MKISFCIPSLNRPEYLIQTIKSICIDEMYSSFFEICIYNNFSDLSYKIVEDEINTLSKKFNIKYHVGSSRLNIDQSMFEAIKPATSEYLFFIGDDDYLFDDGLQSIIDLIEEGNFDMAIFNAVCVNEIDNSKTELMGFSNRIYTKLDSALPELKRFCAYGNILIKRKFIIEEDFRLLFGTSHAYGCFWLAFFKDFEKGLNPTIVVPKQSVVNLRVVNKNYNLLEVVFKHADLEHKLYYNIIGEKSKKVLQEFERDFWRKQSSFKQLIRYEIGNNDLRTIKLYNPDFYQNFRTKIDLARVTVKLLKPIKSPIKLILKLKIMKLVRNKIIK